jgi:hypothetical protein
MGALGFAKMPTLGVSRRRWGTLGSLVRRAHGWECPLAGEVSEEASKPQIFRLRPSGFAQEDTVMDWWAIRMTVLWWGRLVERT